MTAGTISSWLRVPYSVARPDSCKSSAVRPAIREATAASYQQDQWTDKLCGSNYCASDLTEKELASLFLFLSSNDNLDSCIMTQIPLSDFDTKLGIYTEVSSVTIGGKVLAVSDDFFAPSV